MRCSAALMVCCVAMLSACAAVGPDYAGPPQQPVTQGPYHAQAQLPDEAEGRYPAQPPVDAWWQQLQDPVLERLIEQALAANTDLRVALANVIAARALLRESETGLQPAVDASASITRSREAAALEGNPDSRLPVRRISSASLGLAWELDVFGRVRRSIEAAQADIERTQALHEDVKRIVIADVAAAYFDLRGAQERRTVVERNIRNQRETLELTITLAREGIGSQLDTARARAQLTDTQALLPTIISDEQAALNRLARLTGQAPGPLDAALQQRGTLPPMPAFIAVGDAETLIRRRPDIREAERALARLTAQVGVATADLFPTVNFAASIGVAADGFSDLDRPGAENYSVGPGIVWSLFNRSAIRARIAQSRANAGAQLARYDGVVLLALEEVNTALVRHARERQRHRVLQASVEASREAVELVKLRYNAGAESFLGVLDAERTLLEAERQLTASSIDFAQGTIALYRALGGV